MAKYKDKETRLDFATLSKTGRTELDMTLSLEKATPKVVRRPKARTTRRKSTKKKPKRDWSKWD